MIMASTNVSQSAEDIGNNSQDMPSQPSDQLKNSPKDKCSSSQSASPIDGKWAVVVAIGAFLSQAVLAIITYSLPIFALEWEKRLGFTPSQVSWATILVNALRFCTAPVIGAFINSFGCRPVTMLSGFFAMISTILLSLSTELWQINVCCAVIGISVGFANQGTIVIVSMYFDKWLGRANGFAQGGIGVGLMIGSPLMALLIEFYTWRGAAMILAAISAQFSVVASVYRPIRWPTRETSSKTNSRSRPAFAIDNINTKCDETVILDEISVTCGKEYVNRTFVSSSVENHPSDEEIEPTRKHRDHPQSTTRTFDVENGNDSRKQNEYYINETESISAPETLTKSSHACAGNQMKQKIGVCFKYILNLFGFSLIWTNGTVLLLCLIAIFQGIGYFPTYLYLSSFIVSTGETELRASLIFTIIGMCSLCGRLTHGFLVDLNIITSAKLFALSSIIAGASAYIIVVFRTYTAFATFAVVFGVSSGALVALTPVVAKKYTAPSELVHAFALQSFFSGGFQLLGTYFLGLLFDWTNMYRPCFCFTGAFLVIGGMITLLIEPLNRRLNRKTQEG